MAKRSIVGAFIGGIALSALGMAMPSFADSSTTARADDTANLGSPSSFKNGQQVGRLIASLGDKRYVARREAEQQLLEIGMTAFDQIDAGTDHPDPEISASCRFLISELTVHWTRRDDLPQVKAALSNYANQDESERIAVVSKLGNRTDHWAIAPLCRICRYDASPTVTRHAAIALLRTDELTLGYTANDATTLRKEIGTSVRPAAQWIRLLASQIDDSASVVPQWWEAIDLAETYAAAQLDDEQLSRQVTDLLRNIARIELQNENSDAFLLVVDRLIQRATGNSVWELEQLVEWAESTSSSHLVQQLLDRHEKQLSQSKAGLYLLARTRAKQGQEEVATQLAEQAFQMAGESSLAGAPQDRLIQATVLIEHGHIDWARRELRQAISEVPETSDVHSRAAMALAASLHDWQQDSEASQVLLDFTTPLNDNPALLKQYDARMRNSLRSRGGLGRLYSLQEIDAYQHYYQAAHLHAEEDTEGEWQSLEQAIKLDSSNADIIIAMYRASKGNAERRTLALETIRQRCRTLEQSIDDIPYPSYESSNTYNEWAWLVSNTEGDFDKAVRYSLKSIDLFNEQLSIDPRLEPEDVAGLLDTLGRCYFSAGDVKSAIEQQVKAVEYQPHQRVLQRQLDEFRNALATSDG